MVLLSIILSGLAAGLVCSTYLQMRQKSIQRNGVKAKFFAVESQKDRQPRLDKSQSLDKTLHLDKKQHLGKQQQPDKPLRMDNPLRLDNPLHLNQQQRLLEIPFIGDYLKRQKRQRISKRCEAELPRMLDIIAMGMQSGLSFDSAFGLYVHRFNTDLALLCRERFDIWERGLISRTEGLEQLAASVNLAIFDRFCRTAARSIRFGIPMTPIIKEYAALARKEYRNKQQELVLKAPVKMLIPTGVLILPAMMLLVVGPILLDLTGRMV